jgi:hypothetical protein
MQNAKSRTKVWKSSKIKKSPASVEPAGAIFVQIKGSYQLPMISMSFSL